MDNYNEEINNIKTYCIYKITNLINNKGYVGMTSDYERRMNEHCNAHMNLRGIKGAIFKYGVDNFTFDILQDNLTFEESQIRERYNIWLHETFGPLGYNLTSGGGGVSDYHHTKETKNKISFSTTGEKSSWFGRRHTKETRLKMCKNHADVSGEKNPMYGKTGELSPNYGKTGELSCLYNIKQNKEHIEKRVVNIRKLFIIIFPDGHKEITNNLPQFCKDNGLRYGCMIQIANGVKHHKQHRGFRCEHYVEKSS